MCLPRVASPGPATLSGVFVVPSQPLPPSTPNRGGRHLDWVSIVIDVSSINLNRFPSTSVSRSDLVNRVVIDWVKSEGHPIQIERFVSTLLFVPGTCVDTVADLAVDHLPVAD
jgi:hypothetical protein